MQEAGNEKTFQGSGGKGDAHRNRGKLFLEYSKRKVHWDKNEAGVKRA